MDGMDRDTALRLLRAGPDGVAEWNRRMAGGEETPDLKDAFLINADLREVDLRGAFLVGASFCHANLFAANLAGALLNNADFRGADLRCAELHHANLSGAVFGCTLIACDLSAVRGLDSVEHLSRSILDVQSVLTLPGKPLPETFLRGCGLADEEIAHFRSRLDKPIRQASCFICHCSSEAELAARFHAEIQTAGIRCWRWNHDAQICEELLPQGSPAITAYDKFVLLLSRQSLTCESVNRELRLVLEEEDKRSDTAANRHTWKQSPMLIPVRVDNYVFEQPAGLPPLWNPPYRDAVANRTIIDAVGWDKEARKFNNARDRLIEAILSTTA